MQDEASGEESSELPVLPGADAVFDAAAAACAELEALLFVWWFSV
jgi:hypothetical protein